MSLLGQVSDPKINHLFEYINKPYKGVDYINWRDPVWWEKGKWKKFIPKVEHYRVYAKYQTQAMDGYHFGEVLEMIDQKKNGFSWLYENYYLFKNPGVYSKVFSKGTPIIKDIIGEEIINKLHKIVLSRKIRATEPDLFVFRKKSDHTGYDMVFIEVKRGEELNAAQINGFKLIHKYLNIPIKLIHYSQLQHC